MDDLIRDLSYGIRLLVRRPGFTAVAIASLALGVGLNTTLFSVVNAVLAALVGRVLDSLIYGVSALDPMAHAAAAAALLAVVLLATLGPALAAARVDPLKALRSE